MGYSETVTVFHQSGIRVSQGNLGQIVLFHIFPVALIFLQTFPGFCELCFKLLGCKRSVGGFLPAVLPVLFIHLAEVLFDVPFQPCNAVIYLAACEVIAFSITCYDFCAVNGQITCHQVFKTFVKFEEDVFEPADIVFPEVGNRSEIGLGTFHEPFCLNVHMAGFLEFS